MTTSSIRAVALDLDGTLAGSDHRVSPYARSVVRRLEESGIPVIIVTGRTERSARDVAREAGLAAPVVSTGGGVITDAADGRVLYEARLAPAMVERALSVGDGLSLQPILLSAERCWTDRDSELSRLLAEMNQDAISVIDRENWPDAVVKIMLVGDDADVVAEAQRRLDAAGVPAHRSAPTFLEVNRPDATKWHSLERVLTMLGIAPAQTLGAGDGETDLDWLGRIGEAVAVSNAVPEIVAIATTRIGHHADDAVAGYLEERFLPAT